GSVAVEIARICKKGYVYALEKNEEAVALIKANKEKFGIYNMEILQTKCPEGMQGLPVPNKVFIGGSSGQLDSIAEIVLGKNPMAIMVVTAITLETLTETLNCAKRSHLEMTYTQISVANSKTVGSYHMMMGQNPIFIVTMKGKQL
ncbi:MAG: bifunctional cobalt-precorrin-7 (C(5))-methyltransferase/cobalt-precorrin-6B (C(15))-methyltransferase, partial [Niameybacter sp.]